MKIVGVIVGLFATLAASCALAQIHFRPATATETRAAYCMISTKEFVEEGQKIMPSSEQINSMRNLPKTDPEIILLNQMIDTQNAMISQFNRFRQYVLLTLSSDVDPSTILLAEKQAKEDSDRFHVIISEAHCPSLLVDPAMSCSKAVQEKIEVKDIAERMGVCGHSGWLPF
jgi:hypothetical protein